MLTLVIHAPKARVRKDGSRSFLGTFNSGVGEEYAIYSTLPPIPSGSKLVLLSKDEELRAEGDVLQLVPKGKAKNGVQLYDVHVRNLQMVSYKPEPLNRCGVAVI
jgi:hypothetical protein